MLGRCGVDQLNMFLLVLVVILSVISVFHSFLGGSGAVVGMFVNFLCYLLLLWYLFRFFSKNLEKRIKENRRFLSWISRFKDRENRYYRCPNCKQTVRVPKGRGKICIKCPKCGEKFIRKT
ncbi:MAG: hypothetical protein J5789_01585 [Oscillospiraceae bacterium]|nr:hypothetical protein [Oscillospiraceae bacterium]